MAIFTNVPVRCDWDAVPRGELLQASYSGKPVLCIRMPGDRGEVVVLRCEAWQTLPSMTPVEALDPYPLILPGTFLVEPVPDPDGSFASSQSTENGNLRVTSEGYASIVVISSSGRGELVQIGERSSENAESKHPTDFSNWRIIQVEAGQPRSASRTVFEHSGVSR